MQEKQVVTDCKKILFQKDVDVSEEDVLTGCMVV